VGGIGRRTGHISVLAFEGRFGRHYFNFMRSSIGPYGFDAAAAREMRERVRGVSAIAFLARRRSGARKRIDDLGDSPGSYSSEALQLLSPEPQPGPQVGGMLAGVMAARTRHGGGMR
jgi:hypothetical protein